MVDIVRVKEGPDGLVARTICLDCKCLIEERPAWKGEQEGMTYLVAHWCRCCAKKRFGDNPGDFFNRPIYEHVGIAIGNTRGIKRLTLETEVKPEETKPEEARPAGKAKCKFCHGSGKIRRDIFEPEEDCGFCQATGWINTAPPAPLPEPTKEERPARKIYDSVPFPKEVRDALALLLRMTITDFDRVHENTAALVIDWAVRCDGWPESCLTQILDPKPGRMSMMMQMLDQDDFQMWGDHI